MKRARVLATAALLTAGCSLALNTEQPFGPANTCGGSTACSDGAECVDGRCVATSYDLEGLIVEVRPHANATFGSTTSYFFDPAQTDIALRAENASPFVARMSPTLPASIAVREGRVRVHEKTPLGAGCMLGEDRRIPAKVTFYRVAPFTGLPVAPVTATTNAERQLDVDLVPDTYDVYIEPQKVEGCNEELPFPPVYFPAQPITTDGALTWDLPVVGTLTGTIADFGAFVPEGWKLDLLEPDRGLPVSANAKIWKPPNVDTYAIEAQIAWPDNGTPIVRLAPPATAADEIAQPTAYWTLLGSVFTGSTTDPNVNFTVAELFGPPTKVDGHVYGSDGFTGVRATLSIQSASLRGPDANNAAFAVEGIETDEHGGFAFHLPPGKYTVRVTPIDSGLRITDIQDFEVPPMTSCYCGHTWVLEPKLSLTGAVKTPRGERFAAATVSVAPAQLAARRYWESTHTLPPLTPRVSTTTTTDDGHFVLLVDWGSADVVLETPSQSGFPWVVRPRVTLDGATGASSLVITNPAILSGNVRDPQGMPVADAEINAWLPVIDPNADEDDTITVVKIATTSTDANGNYTLLMPSSR